MTSVNRKNGKYLWWGLLSLGFRPETASAEVVIKANVKQINLGTNMFERPNKDAFYIVSNFLLRRLNPTRYNEVFRNCWPVLDPKADAEFRKLTCAWLRDIMSGMGSNCPKVAASLLLSPGGPKFINLMLHLANHVLLKDMKTLSTDAPWMAQAIESPGSSIEIAEKRLELARSRFLASALAQHCLLQENQKQVQSRVKSLRDKRAECAECDKILGRHNGGAAEEQVPRQKIKKVQALWLAIAGMLATIQKERCVMEWVVAGHVDKHILDGTNLALKIPQLLLKRIERIPQQCSPRSMYMAGQPNLLSLLELANHALHLIGEKTSGDIGYIFQRQFRSLQEKSLQMAQAFADLRLMRKSISQQGLPEIKTVIRRLEDEWDMKWKELLKSIHLDLFLTNDPALGYMSPIAPLSFEPAGEVSCGLSVFSHVLKEMSAESNPVTVGSATETDSDLKSISFSGEKGIETVVGSNISSQPMTLQDDIINTPMSSAKTQSTTRKITEMKTSHPASSRKKMVDVIDWECDNLANQFAEAVTTSSVADVNLSRMDLGNILSSLGSNPLSTLRQLPRTPESLIKDVKTSWRTAIEKDDSERVQSPTPVLTNDSVLNSTHPGLTPEPFQSAGHDPGDPAIGQEEASFLLPPSWNSSNVAAPLGWCSGADPFSLENQTLPEMLDDNSFLSEGAPYTFASMDQEDFLPDFHAL